MALFEGVFADSDLFGTSPFGSDPFGSSPFGSNPFGSLVSSLEEAPILGGLTAVTLSSAPVLQSLGVNVAPLGNATIVETSSRVTADFPITGGTVDRAQGNEVVLHQNSGLALSDSTGTVDLSNFRIDTQNHVIDADVTLNGTSAGNLAVFKIGANGSTLTLTQAAATAVDHTLGTTAITASTVIGSAQISPDVALASVGLSSPSLGFLSSLVPSPVTGTEPIIGGVTGVTLTSAATLTSLGVTVTALGSGSLNTSGGTPVADFPITGGTEGPGGDVILHQGSGLSLSDSAGTVQLRDFVIDTKNNVIDANVTLNGTQAGNLAVFNIGANLGLTLTAAAASAVDHTLGTTAITATTAIGHATTSPIAGIGVATPFGGFGDIFSSTSVSSSHQFF